MAPDSSEPQMVVSSSEPHSQIELQNEDNIRESNSRQSNSKHSERETKTLQRSKYAFNRDSGSEPELEDERTEVPINPRFFPTQLQELEKSGKDRLGLDETQVVSSEWRGEKLSREEYRREGARLGYGYGNKERLNDGQSRNLAVVSGDEEPKNASVGLRRGSKDKKDGAIKGLGVPDAGSKHVGKSGTKISKRSSCVVC